jgi:hypothetical protein
MRDRVKPLRNRPTDSLIIDMALEKAELRFAATFIDTRAESLIKHLATLSGIEANKWKPLILPHLGLPSDSNLVELLKKELRGWLPALVAGYRVCPSSSSTFASIPHTGVVENLGPDSVQGRWLYQFEIGTGPLQGLKLRMSVTERMTCNLLYKAVGPRLVQLLPRPRPYDLHKMQVLLGIQDNGGRYCIRNVFLSVSPQTHNRKRMKRYVGKCVRNAGVTCYDCGAGIGDCDLSRHNQPLLLGPCISCGEAKFRLNGKGVCTRCVQTQMESGVPFQVPIKS